MRSLLLLALLLAGCASPPPQSASIVFPDVHGVAFDPADAAYVLVATHDGLYRGDGESWTGVSGMRPDLMGFTVAPNGTFYASGHPASGGNLGFVRSDDAGATWTQAGAAGADFHAMSVSPADAQRVYGWTRGQIHRSDDAGATWQAIARVTLAALAAHPTQRDTVYGTTTASMGRSDDGGATWSLVVEAPLYGVAAGEALYASGKDLVQASHDGGATWATITPPEARGTFAHVATRGASVVVASYEGAIWRSDDAGATWHELHAPSR